MGKKDKKEEEKPKKNNLKAFLKKRAPLYLAGIALIVISVNGVLTEKHLDDFLIDFSEEEQIVVDILMQYNGPNESGLNVKDLKPMSWENLSELVDMGHIIGSHSINHLRLSFHVVID